MGIDYSITRNDRYKGRIITIYTKYPSWDLRFYPNKYALHYCSRIIDSLDFWCCWSIYHWLVYPYSPCYSGNSCSYPSYPGAKSDRWLTGA